MDNLAINTGSNKNVECSFKDHIYTFNIEVKTPEFSTQEKQKDSDSIKISSKGRFDDYFGLSDELKPLFNNPKDNLYEGKPVIDQKRMDNTAKDFLCSSQKKFPEYSDKNCINILVICLDDLCSIDEWCGYFYLNQGLFEADSFIDHREFDKVDLVVFSNLYFKHNRLKNNCDNSWDFAKCFNLISRNMFARTIKPEATIVAHDIIVNYTDECRSYFAENPLPIYPIKHFYYEKLIKTLDFSLF